MSTTALTDIYDLPQEHKDFRDTIRQIVDEQVRPRAAEIDATGEYPWDIRKLFAEQDILAPAVRRGVRRHRHRHADAPDRGRGDRQGVRVERADPDDPGARHAADPALRLRRAEGAPAAASARPASGRRPSRLSEPEAGSDAGVACARPRCATATSGSSTARRTGSRTPAIADFYVVFAVTDRENRRLSAFVVEKDREGFSVGKLEHKLGIKGSPTGSPVFEDVRVPAENLIGTEGKGLSVALGTLERTRLGAAAQAVGIAQGATDYANEYAKERIAFGKPINELQAIQFKLADMETRTAAARELLYKACAMADRNEPGLGKYTSMAKLFASDTAMWVTVEAIQVLGGYGYVTEYPVERMMRDAKITQIYEGTNEIQRVVIARAMRG